MEESYNPALHHHQRMPWVGFDQCNDWPGQGHSLGLAITHIFRIHATGCLSRISPCAGTRLDGVVVSLDKNGNDHAASDVCQSYLESFKHRIPGERADDGTT